MCSRTSRGSSTPGTSPTTHPSSTDACSQSTSTVRIFLSQAAIPHLLQTAGNIVNVVSNSAIQGVPYASAYATSKGGLLQLTRALAVEYLKQPLRVNAVAPAGTRTNLAMNANFPADLDIDLVSRMGGLRGIAEPDDIASVVAFLASDEARAVTGAVYTVDNGLTVS